MAFYAIPPNDRIGLHLFLIATGDFNAMVSTDFGGRLYDAVANFQRKHHLPDSGVLDAETLPLIRREGGVILRSWHMHFENHPFANASLTVPGESFGLVEKRTARGLSFENDNQTMSIDFSFFPEEEAGLGDIFDRLLSPAPDKRIDMKVIRGDFFAIASGGEKYGAYSRYIAIPGGSVGFTVKWNTDTYVNGYRVAIVMANGLLPQRSGSAAVANQEPASPPSEPAPAPPRTASLEPSPKASEVTVSAGSAFFVSAEGDLVTNNHVVKDCNDALIVGRGPAKIISKDPRNDLALLRLVSRPTDGPKPAIFRTSPMQLGEMVYVSGYPYAGALDNGVNFTNGLVSSAAGMGNDTTNFQMTAAVQPGNSGGPVLDQSGALLGIVVARMSDTAAFNATQTIPQNVNFGIKSEIIASFLRVNGVNPAMAEQAPPMPTTQIALIGKSITAQVKCVVEHRD